MNKQWNEIIISFNISVFECLISDYDIERSWGSNITFGIY